LLVGERRITCPDGRGSLIGLHCAVKVTYLIGYLEEVTEALWHPVVVVLSAPGTGAFDQAVHTLEEGARPL